MFVSYRPLLDIKLLRIILLTSLLLINQLKLRQNINNFIIINIEYLID